MLYRTAARGQARQTERRGHQLQHRAARIAVQHFGRVRGKFVVDPLAELRRIGQLIQAAPIFLAGDVAGLDVDRTRLH